MNIRKIVKKFIPTSLFRAIEPYGHLAEAIFWNAVNGFPSRNLKVIGVTGTNGKTTTSFLIHRMLHEAGFKAGLMTTVAYGVGDDIHSQVAHMTTLPPRPLLKRIKWLKSQGVEWLVLETTSQGLAQNRVWGIPYSVAVMTNVTHEHLDYHRTFERYRNAKRKLFKLTDKNHHGLRTGIINAEDPGAQLFASDIKQPLLYGVDKGELRATGVKLAASGVEYGVDYKGQHYDIRCQIPGSFNVYNSLAAIGVGITLGLTPEQIERGIAALPGVEGRMTRIDEGQDYEVIMDFAHTPDSFEKLFKDLRPVVKGKLIALFGTPGRRDATKGEAQGELAGTYCDEVIVTEEDDRDADGQALMEQVARGAAKSGKIRDKNLFLIHDRTEAINFAIGRASKGDTVLLLGKGHEKTIEGPEGERSWNEAATAKRAAKKYQPDR